MDASKFSVVAAVNNRRVLQDNLLRSPALAGRGQGHQLLIQERFVSAALAYNDALDRAVNDIVVFVHQDVYLPSSWFADVTASIAMLEAAGQRWGVLGCFGSRLRDVGLGRVYSTGWGMQGRLIDSPEPVETLDEIVLVIRASTGLRFDPRLPHFHMYGADLCLTARQQGRTNFALPAFCIHNTNQLLALPREFYDGYRFVKRKWAHWLPIQTSCILISRFDGELRRRRLQEWLVPAHRRPASPRASDPTTLVAPELL